MPPWSPVTRYKHNMEMLANPKPKAKCEAWPGGFLDGFCYIVFSREGSWINMYTYLF